MYRSVKENYVVYLKLKDISGINDSSIQIMKATKDVTANNNTIISIDDDIIKISLGTNNKISSILRDIYPRICNSRFNEYIGEYQNNSAVNEEDKITYRIITYVEI